MRRLWMLLLGTALIAAACGGDEETVDATPEVVILDSGADGESAAATGSTDAADGTTTGSGSTDEEQALAFAQCMRDNGVDIADPTVDADGSVNLVPPQGTGTAQFDQTAEAAFETCGDLLDGASFLPGDDDMSEIEDQLLEVAQCLRDQGLDVDDPNLSAIGPGGGGAGGVFGDSFDPLAPENQDAIDSCSDLFTGFGGPQGG